jgi:hypothetical protein
VRLGRRLGVVLGSRDPIELGGEELHGIRRASRSGRCRPRVLDDAPNDGDAFDDVPWTGRG